MTKILEKHPISTCARDLSEICSPLNRLDISYFSWVHTDNNGKFSVLANNENFVEHYFQKKYYNADLHTDTEDKFGNIVIWDALPKTGQSEKLDQEGVEFGVRHTFTIIERKKNGNDFYHFSTHIADNSFNQVYLTNLDLLKMFILHFKENVKKSKELSNQLMFSVDNNASGFTLKNDLLSNSLKFKEEFMKDLSLKKSNNSEIMLIHKDNNKVISLAPHQSKCLILLLDGNSSKSIANKLGLSARTVDHYLNAIRKILGCKNSKELIALYLDQIK